MYSKEIERTKRKLKLKKFQKEVIVGILLGDAHLETQNGGRTYRLKIEQSEKHRDYVWHLYEIFKKWVLTPPQERIKSVDGKKYKMWWFNTISCGSFRFYAHQFYSDGRKCVPKLIHRWLSPRAIAYWFCDDGSMKSRQSKGVIFNTQGFQRKDVDRLIAVLIEKYGLLAKKRKQPEGWQIYISGKSYERFIEIVKPYIFVGMQYKIPPKRMVK